MKSFFSRHVTLMHAIGVSCVLTAALGCQVHRTAHPQETVENGNGNAAPFGCLSPTEFTEARTQILIRNEELPGPGATLVAIEIHCQDMLSLDYLSLEIDAESTRATALSPKFDDNITPLADSLLRAKDRHIAFDSHNWTPITLQNNHVHDGVSGLVIEIRKIVDPGTARFATMSTPSNPVRTDLPLMAYSFGGPGSGASTAETAQELSTPLSLGLIWINAPTVRLRGDAAASGNQFGLGGSVVHTVEGKPGAFAVNFIATSFLETPMTFDTILGRLLIPGVPINVTSLPLSGRVRQTIPIPSDGSLVGLHVVFQSGTIEAVSGLTQLTNSAEAFINS